MIGLGGGSVSGGGGSTIRINTREVNTGQTTNVAFLRPVGLALPVTFGRLDGPGNAIVNPDGTIDLNTALDPGESASFVAYAQNSDKGTIKQFVVVAIPASLNAITLSPASFQNNSLAGTNIGTFVGRTAGSTIYVSDARVQVSSDNSRLEVGTTNSPSATSFSIDIEETWTDGSVVLTNTSTVTVTVTAIVTIGSAATLSSSTVPEGSPVDTRVGQLLVETGVTPTLANDGGGFFKLVGTGPWYIDTTSTPLDFETTPTISISIAQAKAGATNDGVTNDIAITVTYVYTWVPKLNGSDKNNSAILFTVL